MARNVVIREGKTRKDVLLSFLNHRYCGPMRAAGPPLGVTAIVVRPRSKKI
jgi:hypothetical protein